VHYFRVVGSDKIRLSPQFKKALERDLRAFGMHVPNDSEWTEPLLKRTMSQLKLQSLLAQHTADENSQGQCG
jgi:hypothetical protein